MMKSTYWDGTKWQENQSAGSFSCLYNKPQITSITNTVLIGISGYDKSVGVLQCLHNGELLYQNVDFTISSDSLSITKVNDNFNPGDSVELAWLSIANAEATKLTIGQFQSSYTVITNGETNIPLNTANFNAATDFLIVTYNDTVIRKDVHYSLNANNVSIDLINWTIPTKANDEFGYIILKAITSYSAPINGSDITATSVNKSSLTQPIQDTLTLADAQRFNLEKQAIINGNFDVWQRATSSIISSGVFPFVADRWKLWLNADGGVLPIVTHSRQQLNSGELDKSFYFYRINTNGTGTSLGVNSYGLMSQSIENGTRLLCGLGKTVTLSFYARSSIVGKRLGLYAQQSYGNGGSPSADLNIMLGTVNLNTTWTKYTLTIPTNTLVGKVFGTNNDDCLNIVFAYMWGTTFGNGAVGAGVSAETFVGLGNIDITQVQVNAGSIALPFTPKSYQDELKDCMRYYEQLTEVQCYACNQLSALRLRLFQPFKVFKRVVPIISVTSIQDSESGGTISLTGLTFTSQQDRVRLSYGTLSGVTNGYTYLFNGGADAEL